MRIKPPLRDTQLESPAGWCIRCRNELGSYDTNGICKTCKEEEENDCKAGEHGFFQQEYHHDYQWPSRGGENDTGPVRPGRDTY